MAKQIKACMERDVQNKNGEVPNVRSFMQTSSIEERINKAVQGPVLNLVSEQQKDDPANKKLVVKIGDLNKIKEMLRQSVLCQEPTENMDFVLSKVVEILNRQCLSEAKEFAQK